MIRLFLFFLIIFAACTPVCCAAENWYQVTHKIASSIDVLQQSVNTANQQLLIMNSYLDAVNSNLVVEENETQSLLDMIEENTTPVSTVSGVLENSFNGENYDMVDVQFQYGVTGFDTSSATTGSGTITSSNGLAILQTGATATSSARLESKKALRRSGQEFFVLFGALFENPAASSLMYIGALDDTNGCGIGFSGTSFSVITRTAGVDTTIPQINFNHDKLDGSGPSGFLFDPTKFNVFRIRQCILGAACFSFEIMSSGGEWIVFHTIENVNGVSTPAVANALVPLRAYVTKTAGATNVTLRTAGWLAGSFNGSDERPASRFFGKMFSKTVSLLNGETHVATLRNRSTYQSVPNTIRVRITYGGASGLSSTTPLALRLIKNGTVASTSFSNFDTASSVVEMSTAGSYTNGTGLEVFGLVGTALFSFISPTHEIELAPNETLTILVSNLLSILSLDIRVIIGWEECF